jgi:1-hydroxycarotenoid 3,4-desaturase
MANKPIAALRDQHVIVVGAGIAGLVCALRLACQGIRVTVLERAATPGGKMRQFVVQGAAIDAGPTVFTMRWIFDQIFAAAGTTLEQHLKLDPLHILARHAWSETEQLNLYADQQQSAQAIGEFAGASQAQRFLQFCAQAREVYQTLEGPYIRSSKPTLMRMVRDLGPRGLWTLTKLGPFATLWQNLARQFSDVRLQQLFGRYATYTGSSPWLAPATLMLIAQVEMDGVWSIRGGMHALAQALEKLAVQHGVQFCYQTHVARILTSHGRASGVQLADGAQLNADAVVYNGDAGALAAGLMGKQVHNAAAKLPRHARSLSALTWAVHAPVSGFDLARHNVFFQRNYANEFSDIFKRGVLPTSPTVYVCAQDRGVAESAPPQTERLLCLINAPACGDVRAFTAGEIEQCEHAGFSLLRTCGLQIERNSFNTVLTTPQDFNQLFPGTGGALYGQAARGWMDTFTRPGSASRLPGLYLAGGGAHPGPGVPMAAMSGQLAAETLLAHLASTSKSQRVVISGGTSTRSAIAANTL